jgi:catechol 2,3-dioxygenase-like lactoylglutathione lyase family enzyme
MPPRHEGITETVLAADDVDEMVAFYRDVMGLEYRVGEPGAFACFDVAGRSLLVFNRADSLRNTTVPKHGTSGAGHLAFGIAASELDPWREHLARHGVPLEHVHHWELGGVSLYFRDPGGNSVELATPGIWGHPSGW